MYESLSRYECVLIGFLCVYVRPTVCWRVHQHLAQTKYVGCSWTENKALTCAFLTSPSSLWTFRTGAGSLLLTVNVLTFYHLLYDLKMVAGSVFFSIPEYETILCARHVYILSLTVIASSDCGEQLRIYVNIRWMWRAGPGTHTGRLEHSGARSRTEICQHATQSPLNPTLDARFS